MVPLVSIADLAISYLPRHQTSTISPGALRSLYAIHSPVTHPVQTPSHRAMIVAAAADKIINPWQPEALWKHWSLPEIHWVERRAPGVSEGGGESGTLFSIEARLCA